MVKIHDKIDFNFDGSYTGMKLKESENLDSKTRVEKTWFEVEFSSNITRDDEED